MAIGGCGPMHLSSICIAFIMLIIVIILIVMYVMNNKHKGPMSVMFGDFGRNMKGDFSNLSSQQINGMKNSVSAVKRIFS